MSRPSLRFNAPSADVVGVHWALIANFAKREMKSRYRRSVLGWAWSMLNPLATVAVYSLVFGVFFRTPPPDTANGRAETFALYLFTGLMTWSLFTAVLNGAMDWLQQVSDLRKKVFFPTETAIFGGAAAAGVQALLEAMVLMTFMIALDNVSWTVVFLPVVMLGAALFGLGIGFVVAIYNALYRDVRYLTGIALQVVFFLVPIVYTMEIVPETAYGLPVRTIIEFNPMTQFIEAARDAVYYLRVPSTSRLLAIGAYAAIPFLAGWKFFRVRSMSISEEL